MKKASSTKVHVIKRGTGWAVKSEGASKAAKVYKTQEMAAAGAKKSGKAVVIHKKDGTIRKWIQPSR